MSWDELELIAAVINGALTTAAVFASRRSLLAGLAAGVAIPAGCVAALWFLPLLDPRSEPAGQVFWTWVAIVLVTWLPGAFLAIVAGRRWPLLGVGAVCVGLAAGAAFPFTLLFFACGFLGGCH